MRWGKHKHFTIEIAKQSFLSKTRPDPSGCIIWTGAIGSHKRYGILGFMGKHWLAHRAAWFLHTGEDPIGKCVCHKCDNGFCVNPEHLFIGTQNDNVLDMERKGRSYHPKGECHGRAKIGWGEVEEMRRLHASGVSIREIARRYPILTRTSIAAIIHRKTWVTK